MDMVQGPELKAKTYNEIHFYESDDVFHLNQQKIKTTVRQVIIPGLNDSENDVIALREFTKNSISSLVCSLPCFFFSIISTTLINF